MMATRYYYALGRSTGYAINGTRQTTIAYDSFGRIATMSVPSGQSNNPNNRTIEQFSWAYLPGSDLKASLQYPNGLTASWTYDANNQLLQVCNATPTNVISQFDYTYDAAGRRTAIAKSGTAFGDLSGSIDSYTYNTRSELTSARRTKNGQPIPGFSEDFDYDPIGNRRSSATYNERGEAQTSIYQANNLNQYTQRTTPGYAAVRGEADPNATVTVNENPTFRFGSYYFGSDLFDNTTAGGLANLETYATLSQTAANGDETEDLVSSETNQVYIAQSPETFDYDDDGNQTLVTTRTGRWRVEYNGENRPVRWTREGDGKAVAMTYDHMGRRRTKDGQRFFYDGYLQVANERTVSNAVVRQSFVWDPTEPVATRPLAWFGSNAPPRLYTHDGNKNVSEVVAAASGTNATVEVVAHYDYAAFGAVIAQKGGCAETNPWRFSSEYEDTDLGLDYYNYRHYEPVTGRWLTRDMHIGSAHLYSYVENACIDYYDELGLTKRGSRNANRDNVSGHRSRKNGNKWQKHSGANSHGGHWNKNFTYHDRRGKPYNPMKKGCVDSRLLLRFSAVEIGVLVGNIALSALEDVGWFDETVDWSYEVSGELCCEEPFKPRLVGLTITLRTGMAEIDGPVWGVFTPTVTAYYEFEKSISLVFACCCDGKTKNRIMTVKSRETPVVDTWAWGFGGSAEGVAVWTQITMKQECDK